MREYFEQRQAEVAAILSDLKAGAPAVFIAEELEEYEGAQRIGIYSSSTAARSAILDVIAERRAADQYVNFKSFYVYVCLLDSNRQASVIHLSVGQTYADVQERAGEIKP